MTQRYIIEADWGIAVRKINPNSQFTGTLEDITWQEDTTPISREDIQTKINEMNAELDNKETLKASAKAKLIAGEALTEEEANTIVL